MDVIFAIFSEVLLSVWDDALVSPLVVDVQHTQETSFYSCSL